MYMTPMEKQMAPGARKGLNFLLIIPPPNHYSVQASTLMWNGNLSVSHVVYEFVISYESTSSQPIGQPIVYSELPHLSTRVPHMNTSCSLMSPLSQAENLPITNYQNIFYWTWEPSALNLDALPRSLLDKVSEGILSYEIPS